MVDRDRRQFLQLGAGAAALSMLPASIARALALPAKRRSGTIEDVEHIVVFMQENRSFDHYFGHLRGVRGYNDRFPVLRADGRPVWHQPREADPERTVLPFHLKTQLTSAECVLDLDHSWYRTHAAIAAGRNDQWPPHKSDMTMGYYLRDDIPFHYALADAFTICDQYFCSTPNQTHPNRMYLMSGMVDPTGRGGGPLLDNNDEVDRVFTKKVLPPFTYTTYPERLDAAGISWQVYQQGVAPDDDYEGNFGTNVLGNFKSFIEAPHGSARHRRGMSKRTLDDLAADVMADRLPQVSWLLSPAAFSEHPRWTPGYGATYIARVLDALTANPDVWAKTVLLLMYDENDGYFDHVPPPQPPTPALPGKSTVSVDGEVHDYVNPLNADKYHIDHLPYGLGPRVPMLAISPWSKGGFVCSEVFDHTSVIRFIERRFGVREPNITDWRRTVCGDLTSAFDFGSASAAKVPLPDTTDYRRMVDESCRLPQPVVPPQSAETDIGAQEPGVRPARPLPYALSVKELAAPDDTFAFRLVNTGRAGAVFHVYREHRDDAPRRYTVEAGKSIDDAWILPAGTAETLFTITGPNGFFRRLRAGPPSPLRVTTRDMPDRGSVVVKLANAGDRPLHITISDMAYGQAARETVIPPRRTIHEIWSLSESAYWYDLRITLPDDPRFEHRLAGHVETGRPSTSDPAAQAPTLV